MISHVTIGTDDVVAAARFYDAVLAPLGYVRRYTYERAVGYGHAEDEARPDGTDAKLWVMRPFDDAPAASGNGWHAAFVAPSREAVHAFHAAALASGGTDEGAPGPRPRYGPGYYAAYVRDPDGNKLQAVHSSMGAVA